MLAFCKRDAVGRLVAADGPSDEALRKLRFDKVLRVEVVQPRNVKHHRLYWALCHLVAENMDGVTAETVSDVLKIRTGHANVVRTIKGEVASPKSISFAAMDQTAFDAFFQDALRVVCDEVIPGLDSADLEREVKELIEC